MHQRKKRSLYGHNHPRNESLFIRCPARSSNTNLWLQFGHWQKIESGRAVAQSLSGRRYMTVRPGTLGRNEIPHQGPLGVTRWKIRASWAQEGGPVRITI